MKSTFDSFFVKLFKKVIKKYWSEKPDLPTGGTPFLLVSVYIVIKAVLNKFVAKYLHFC